MSTPENRTKQQRRLTGKRKQRLTERREIGMEKIVRKRKRATGRKQRKLLRTFHVLILLKATERLIKSLKETSEVTEVVCRLLKLFTVDIILFGTERMRTTKDKRVVKA